MVQATLLLAVLGLVAPAFSAPQSAKRFVDYTIHHERSSTPPLWTRVNAESASARDKRSLVARDTILPVRINLAQRNVERAHDILMDISDPESERYGAHLSPEDVAELVSGLFALFFPRRTVSDRFVALMPPPSSESVARTSLLRWRML